MASHSDRSRPTPGSMSVSGGCSRLPRSWRLETAPWRSSPGSPGARSAIHRGEDDLDAGAFAGRSRATQGTVARDARPVASDAKVVAASRRDHAIRRWSPRPERYYFPSLYFKPTVMSNCSMPIFTVWAGLPTAFSSVPLTDASGTYIAATSRSSFSVSLNWAPAAM